eukprot:TRINITY_DN6244_c0_g1_i1.p1 TRINITY_DN6244_c0_g1~~TRINITY_DN6244_c0_g1_i1.p1  ORF type:complete len:112 (-),score=7.60 TRINITY_DN6244_c0_g1_i1:1209-1544(-)
MIITNLIGPVFWRTKRKILTKETCSCHRQKHDVTTLKFSQNKNQIKTQTKTQIKPQYEYIIEYPKQIEIENTDKLQVLTKPDSQKPAPHKTLCNSAPARDGPKFQHKLVFY